MPVSDDPLEQLAAEEAGNEPAQAPQEEEAPAWAGRFETPDVMFQSYQHAEQKIGELGNELGELRKFREQVEPLLSQMNQPQPAPYEAAQQYLPDGTPILPRQRLEELAIESPLEAMDLMARYRAWENRTQVEQEFRQQYEPILAQVNRQSASGALDALKRDLGPNGEQLLADHKDDLLKAIERDKDSFVDETTRVARMKQAVMAAAFERQMNGTTQTRARDPQGRYAPAEQRSVHVEGGSSPQPSLPPQPGQEMDPDIAELLAFREKSDLFGRR